MPVGGANYVRAWLSDDGTNTGALDQVVDGSVTPVPFFRGPGVGVTWEVRRLTLTATLGSLLTLTDFGSAFGGLTNGISLQVWDEVGSSLITDLLDGQTIQTNADLVEQGSQGGNALMARAGQTPASLVKVQWQFSPGLLLAQDPGTPVFGSVLRTVVSDDLTAVGLTTLRAYLEGAQVAA